MVIWTDDGGVQVAPAVDLGGTQHPDLDPSALEEVGEQVVHRHRRGCTRHESGVADAVRQARRSGADDARLVDELQVRRHGLAGEVGGGVGQADADEDGPDPDQLRGRGRDHELVR